jgi:hypothetical protein
LKPLETTREHIVGLFYSKHNLELEMIGMSVGQMMIDEPITLSGHKREESM